uniref:Uncharacterized protein MANES_18G091900 n=1 Tax=Rhizophora mucronata TaxID=61149 RepID=A0A2P2JER0_RHIMU
MSPSLKVGYKQCTEMAQTFAVSVPNFLWRGDRYFCQECSADRCNPASCWCANTVAAFPVRS